MTTEQAATRGARLQNAVALAAPGVLAFTVPPFGIVASLLLPLMAWRVGHMLWPQVRRTMVQFCAALAVIGLWLPAALALVTNGRVGSEAGVWLLIPLCAPSGTGLVVPAALAAAAYLGLAASAVLRSPWAFVLGAWAAPLAYWAASSWLVDFSCVA